MTATDLLAEYRRLHAEEVRAETWLASKRKAREALEVRLRALLGGSNWEVSVEVNETQQGAPQTKTQ